ncbi:MAG: ubiquinone biosynthesis accessory factor UbiJ [Endozoicomonas sp.]
MAARDPAIKTGLLMGIERQVNALLSLDPVVFKRLSACAGKVIRVQVTSPDMECLIHLERDGLRLASVFEEACDAVFKGSGVSLASLVVQRPVSFEDVSGVEVSGCSQLLSALEATHNLVELDWESVLCRVFGDLGGHFIVRGLRFAGWQVRQGRQFMEDNAGGFLQEELQMAPSRPEVDGFGDELNHLVDSVGCLESRVEGLLKGPAGQGMDTRLKVKNALDKHSG